MVKIVWGDMTFPPINQYVLISATNFYKLMEEYAVPYSRFRDLNISEGQPVQPPEQSVSLRVEDTLWAKTHLRP